MDPKKIFDIISSEDIKPLDSSLEIDDLIVVINGYNEKIKFQQEFKKRKVAKIDEEIDRLEANKDKFMQVIIATMNATNNKSLNFPGTGRVSVRKVSGKWEIKDKESLKQYLKDNLDETQYKSVTKTEEVLVKKEVDVVLDSMIGSNPDIINFAVKTKDSQSVTLSFDEDINVKLDEMKDSDYSRVDGLSIDKKFDGI